VENFERWKTGEKIEGRYEILRILKGGMGVVYVCYDNETGYPIAIKTFQDKCFPDEKAKKDFVREAEIWIRLGKHKNIVKAHWVNNISRKPYIFLEYVSHSSDGKNTLRHYMQSNLDLAKTLNFAVQFCDGMVYARRKVLGLVHRDIKPENVMITPDGVVKVTDFGLARSVQYVERHVFEIDPSVKTGFDDLAFDVSRGGGTPSYMAPEQFPEWILNYFGENSRPITSQADIYAFGLVLYEMVTRRHVFQTDKTEEQRIRNEAKAIAQKMCQDTKYLEIFMAYVYCFLKSESMEPRKISTGHKRMDEIIANCLRNEPKERYSDFEELRGELDDVYYRLTDTHISIEMGETEHQAWELSNIGVSLFELGRVDEGIVTLRKSVELENDARTHINLGEAYVKKGWTDLAIKEFEEAAKLDPNGAEAYNNLGAVYLEKGLTDQAITEFKRALELNLNIPMAHYNLGNAYRRKGLLDQAIAEYKRAIQLNPDLVEVQYNLGVSYFNKGLLDQAIAELTRTTELDPNYAMAHNSLGLAFDRKGWTDKAIAAYRRAIELNPNYADACNNLGVAYVEKGWLDQAIKEYKRAIELNPNLAEIYYNLGGAYEKKGLIDEAITAYKRAIELNPNNAEAYDNLGKAYASKGWIDHAATEFKRAIELNANLAEAHYNLGVAYATKSLKDEAITELKKAVELNPNLVLAHFNLAVLLYYSKRFDLAWKHVRIAEKLGMPTQNIHYLINKLREVYPEP